MYPQSVARLSRAIHCRLAMKSLCWMKSTINSFPMTFHCPRLRMLNSRQLKITKEKSSQQTDLTHNHKVLIMWRTSELAVATSCYSAYSAYKHFKSKRKNANKITLSKIEIIRQIQQVRTSSITHCNKMCPNTTLVVLTLCSYREKKLTPKCWKRPGNTMSKRSKEFAPLSYHHTTLSKETFLFGQVESAINCDQEHQSVLLPV